MKLTFNINILSDYHIGAGYGAGIIDSLILKDRNGTPVIRGTTLTGLLRQGMWDLLQSDLLKEYRLCQQSGGENNAFCEEKDKSCPICRILGSPGNPKKWKISSAEVLVPSTLKSGKVIWRNRVSPITRTAETRRLFAQEIMGGGIIFQFTVENEEHSSTGLEEAAFIVAAFRMIRNIGAFRRKGKGQCRFHLVEITPALPGTTEEGNNSLGKRMLEIFRTRWLENKELNDTYKNYADQPVEFSVVTTPSEKRKRFNLVVLTKEPLLVAKKSEAGNRFHTIDYIPGETLLGALAWKIANKWDLTEETVYKKFINLFYKNGIKVSSLYPGLKIGNDIYPTIPAPLDFFTCKLEPLTAEDEGHGGKSLIYVEKGLQKCAKCSEKGLEIPLEPLTGFISFATGNTKKIKVSKREEMHISIDLQSGKAKRGELFGYTAIEEGQYFIGTVEVENWDEFVHLVGIDENSLELRLGKGSSRGYGLVKAWFSEENAMLTFRGKPLDKRVQDWSEPLVMTLLTDTILTDYWGRFCTALDGETLKQILGIEVEVINSFVKTKNISGFNSHLGLPKWQAKAIAAGSTVSFRIKNTPQDIAKLLDHFARLENEGIGLRRAEGFGQIAFNHPVYGGNYDIKAGIRLPGFMRIQTQEEKVKVFEDDWQRYLARKIQKDSFSQSEWVLFSRWLTENIKALVAADKTEEVLTKFHYPDIMELVNSREPCRDKKGFLDEKGQKGRKILPQIFTALADLVDRMESEDEDTKKYLLTKGIEMLAGFITSCQEVKP